MVALPVVEEVLKWNNSISKEKQFFASLCFSEMILLFNFEFRNMAILFIVIVLVIIIVVVCISVANQKERQEDLEFALKYADDFTASFTINNFDSRYSFSIDDNKRKILYIIAENSIKHLLDFENVISVEILEDSNTTFSKSSLRTIGGGVIGGVIGGGAGAIIGGLSGSNKGKKKVSKITVKILLRNYPMPALYIDCLNTNAMSLGESLDADNTLCQNAMNEARQIADRLSVVIDLMDREAKLSSIESVENKPLPNNSIADELEKLHALKDKGIISEDEFTKLKEKLLQK